MSIGAGIFLIALGAILAFAVRTSPDWLNVQVVGWVLMVTGLVVLVLSWTIWSKRRRGTTVTEKQVYEPGESPKVSERRVYRDTRAAPPHHEDDPGP